MSVADRFAEYVAELHELGDSHRLPYGKPKDLVRLVEAFQNSEIFAVDFGCVMRSIVLREHFKASESELLTLVAVAWAGVEPDNSTPQLLEVIQELRGILHKSLAQKVLGHHSERPFSASSELSEEGPELSPNLPDMTAERKMKSPDVQMKPSPLLPQDSGEIRRSAAEYSVSEERHAPSQNRLPRPPGATLREPEPGRSSQTVPLNGAWQRRMPGKEDRRKSDRRKSSDHPPIYGSGSTGQISSTRRLKPSAPEILAMGLAGLMTALLFSVGSLPIYRARVSVYLPSTTAGMTDSQANASSSSPGVLYSGSRGESLLNGGLTEKVAQRLLAQPHSDAVVRQDVLSRGMRELHLGGNETILYADLVAETAAQVKVTHLPPQDLYAVTCDSWSAQFAAIFCNQLTGSLIDQPSAAIPSPEGTEHARIVDAASQPGSPVYPRWYLQGFVGLASGCLIGVLLGFVKRPELRPVKGNDLRT
jgi:hypothetical protein